MDYPFSQFSQRIFLKVSLMKASMELTGGEKILVNNQEMIDSQMLQMYVVCSVCSTHGEIIYGGTRWIEDDCSATFSEYFFYFLLV